MYCFFCDKNINFSFESNINICGDCYRMDLNNTLNGRVEILKNSFWGMLKEFKKVFSWRIYLSIFILFNWLIFMLRYYTGGE